MDRAGMTSLEGCGGCDHFKGKGNFISGLPSVSVRKGYVMLA